MKTSRAFVLRAKPANMPVTASKVSDVSTDFVRQHARRLIVASASVVSRENRANLYGAAKRFAEMKGRPATRRVIVSQGSPVPTVNAPAQAKACIVARMRTARWANAAKTVKAALIFANNSKPVKQPATVPQDKPVTTVSVSHNRFPCIAVINRTLAPQDKSVIALMGNATNAPIKCNAKALVIAPKAKIVKMADVLSIRFLCIVASLRDVHPMLNVPTPMARKAHAIRPLAKATQIVENPHVFKLEIDVVKSNRPANGGSVPIASTKASVFAIRATARVALKVSAKWLAIVPKVKTVTAENASLLHRGDVRRTVALSRAARLDSVASNPTVRMVSAQAQSAKFPKIVDLQHANRSAAVIACNSSLCAMTPETAEQHAA